MRVGVSFWGGGGFVPAGPPAPCSKLGGAPLRRCRKAAMLSGRPWGGPKEPSMELSTPCTTLVKNSGGNASAWGGGGRRGSAPGPVGSFRPLPTRWGRRGGRSFRGGRNFLGRGVGGRSFRCARWGGGASLGGLWGGWEQGVTMGTTHAVPHPLTRPRPHRLGHAPLLNPPPDPQAPPPDRPRPHPILRPRPQLGPAPTRSSGPALR